MISKNEYLYYKSKLRTMEDELFNFQYKDENLKMLETYNKMSEEAKQALKDKWTAYYNSVQTSDIYKNFVEARKALSMGNVHQAKACATKAKTLEVTLSKPSTEDPEILVIKLIPYHNLVKKVAQYTAVVEEYDDVYESKKSNSFETI